MWVPGQREGLADEVHEERARLDRSRMGLAVDGQLERMQCGSGFSLSRKLGHLTHSSPAAARAIAVSRPRLVKTRMTLRL